MQTFWFCTQVKVKPEMLGKHQSLLRCYMKVFYSKLVPKFRLRDTVFLLFKRSKHTQVKKVRHRYNIFTSKEGKKTETQTKKNEKNGIHTTDDGDFPQIRSMVQGCHRLFICVFSGKHFGGSVLPVLLVWRRYTICLNILQWKV